MKSFFQRIRLFFFWYFFKDQLKKKKTATSSKSKVNLEKAKSIGILFDATDLSQRQTVLNYAEKLKNQRKQVKLLGFFDNRLKDNNFTFRHFNRTNIDWAMRPKGEMVNEFLNQKFDLLLHINMETNLHSEYISALSNASFKVGPVTDHVFCYDLMIDMPNEQNLSKFISQMEGLLKKTNP